MSERLAYLAGIVDGEGYIGIKRVTRHDRVTPGHHARIQVKMNLPAPAVAMLCAEFGGSWRIEREMRCWQATDYAAGRVITALLPWLVVKRAQAENLLTLRALQATSVSHRTKVVGTRNFPNAHGTPRTVESRALSDEYVARCDELWRHAKVLNGRGVVPDDLGDSRRGCARAAA